VVLDFLVVGPDFLGNVAEHVFVAVFESRTLSLPHLNLLFSPPLDVMASKLKFSNFIPSLPFLLRVTISFVSRRFVKVVPIFVGKDMSWQSPREAPDQVSFPFLIQLFPVLLLS